MGKISLMWAKRVIIDNSNSFVPGSREKAIREFYEYLINYARPIYHTAYGNRIAQRIRVYEVIELIRDTIYHRKVEYGYRKLYF